MSATSLVFPLVGENWSGGADPWIDPSEITNGATTTANISAVGNGNVRDLVVQLRLGGVLIGSNFADFATDWPGSAGNKTYGGTNNLLGTSGLTGYDVKAAGDIGVALQANFIGLPTLGMQYLLGRAYYLNMGGFPPDSAIIEGIEVLVRRYKVWDSRAGVTRAHVQYIQLGLYYEDEGSSRLLLLGAGPTW